jgi:hypothetical protein
MRWAALGAFAIVALSTMPAFGDEPALQPNPPLPASTSTTTVHTIYPWLLVGVGTVAAGVGTVLIAAAPNLPTNCQKDGPCTRNAKETDAQLAADQSEASKSQSEPTWGLVAIAVGAILVAGGLYWYFAEADQTQKPQTAKAKTPWLQMSSRGLVF